MLMIPAKMFRGVDDSDWVFADVRDSGSDRFSDFCAFGSDVLWCL